MKRVVLLTLSVLAFTAAGCSSAKEAGSEAGVTAADARQAKLRDVQSQEVRVYVDGRSRGAMPRTVRIRRSFGDSSVILRKGKEVLREFELELAYTNSAYSLNDIATLRGDRTNFTITDLNRLKNGRYIIPYTPRTIQIEDHEYGLTMVIEE